MTHRILFCGTPDFAVPCLKALLSMPGIQVTGVVTQPDKPQGRGQKILPPPVKILAETEKLPVFQPRSLKNLFETPEDKQSDESRLAQHITNIRHDMFVVVAYGKILPLQFITAPRLGCVNIHASLLPRWRGAAPIQRCILEGDRETGVCLMQIVEALDAGPVYATKRYALKKSETTGSLHDQLSEFGAELLTEKLLPILNNQLHPIPQADEGVTYAAKWERDDIELAWERDAEFIDRQVRANAPRPGARAKFDSDMIKVFEGHPIEGMSFSKASPGEIVALTKGEVIISTGKGVFAITRLQFPGKRSMKVDEIQTKPFQVGDRFTLRAAS